MQGTRQGMVEVRNRFSDDEFCLVLFLDFNFIPSKFPFLLFYFFKREGIRILETFVK